MIVDKHALQWKCEHPAPSRGEITEETEWHEKRPTSVVKYQHCHCGVCGMFFARFVSRKPKGDA